MNSPVAVAVGHFGDGFTRSDIEGSEEVFSGCDGCSHGCGARGTPGRIGRIAGGAVQCLQSGFSRSAHITNPASEDFGHNPVISRASSTKNRSVDTPGVLVDVGFQPERPPDPMNRTGSCPSFSPSTAQTNGVALSGV